MDKQQRFLELRKIFYEVLVEKAKSFFIDDSRAQSQPLNSQKRKITSYNVKGDMLFLDKYTLVGDGDGGNELISQINGCPSNTGILFIIPDDSSEMCKFWLCLDHPSFEIFDDSYFVKESQNNTHLYRLDCEEMLENEEFRHIILQMFKDIAPECVKDIDHLIA